MNKLRAVAQEVLDAQETTRRYDSHTPWDDVLERISLDSAPNLARAALIMMEALEFYKNARSFDHDFDDPRSDINAKGNPFFDQGITAEDVLEKVNALFGEKE